MGLDIVILGSVIYLTANWKRRVLVMSVRESITGRKLEVFLLFQLGKNHGCSTAACICWLSSEQPCKNWIWYDSTLERPQKKEVPTAKQPGTIDQHKIGTFATRHKLLIVNTWYPLILETSLAAPPMNTYGPAYGTTRQPSWESYDDAWFVAM